MVASVIIPNWNGKHLLKTCLSSLCKQTLKNFEVIVVDNGSMDGSVQYVEKYFPKIQIIPLHKNFGFAKAVNEGIKKSKAKLIMLLNNDTEVDKNCLKFLVEAIEIHRDIGFVATRMLNFYHRDLIDAAGDFIDEVGHANNIGLGEKNSPRFNKSGYTFLATGGGGMFKRALFQRIGFLDENYFAYFEDIDLCLRAQFQGYKGWYEPKAVIYHIHKATSSKNLAFLEYLQFRNMTLTIIKDFPTSIILKKWRWLKIILVHLNTIFYLFKKGYVWPPILADLWILIHLPQLFIKRRDVQKSRIVSDEYIESFLKEKKISFWGLKNKV